MPYRTRRNGLGIEAKLGIGFIIAWVIGGLVSLAITVGIIIVAIHFIAKFW